MSEDRGAADQARLKPYELSVWRAEGASSMATRCVIELPNGGWQADKIKSAIEMVVAKRAPLRKRLVIRPGMQNPQVRINDAAALVFTEITLEGKREPPDQISMLLSLGDGGYFPGGEPPVAAHLVHCPESPDVLVLSFASFAVPDAAALKDVLQDLGSAFAERDITEHHVSLSGIGEQASRNSFSGRQPHAAEEHGFEDQDFVLPFELTRLGLRAAHHQMDRLGASLTPREWQQCRIYAEMTAIAPMSLLLGTLACLLSRLRQYPNVPITLSVDNQADRNGMSWLRRTFSLAPDALLERCIADIDAVVEEQPTQTPQDVRRLEERLQVGHGLGILFAYASFTDAWPLEFGTLLGLRLPTVETKAAMMCWEVADRLDLAICFDRRRIDPDGVSRLLSIYKKLLSELIRDPTQRLGRVDIMDAESRLRVSAMAGAHQTPYLTNSFLRAFEEQSRWHGHELAVAAPDRRLTFAELEVLSSRLARTLAANGVQRGHRVAYFVGRTCDLVIAPLAIAKAGAAFVPLDPKYPAQRLQDVIDQVKPTLIVVDGANHARLPPVRTRILVLGNDSEPALHSSPALRGEPEDECYIIHTSGTTGRPRGVVIPNRALGHYVAAMADRLSLAPGDRYLMTASISFSSSIRQVFVPLCAGAAVVIAGQEDVEDAERLCCTIRDLDVTHVDVVPEYWASVLRTLSTMNYGPQSELLRSRLALVLFASDVLPYSTVAGTWGLFGKHVCLINMFGSTETTGIVTTYTIDPRSAPRLGSLIPVGRPLANMSVHLLDDAMQPVPPGTEGDLYVAGPQIASGYNDDPASSVQSFVDDPAEPGKQLFATGDRGIWRRDDQLELRGRRDDAALKIRGIRIEAGDVEAALDSHPAVHKSAVVVMEEDESMRLVGFTLSKSGQNPSTIELRHHLGQLVPSNMIPDRFVAVQEWPTTLSGKINRAALLRGLPEYVQPNLPTDSITPTQAGLIEIWCALLKQLHVGISSDFFGLGGNSLLGLEMLLLVRKRFGVRLGWGDFLKAPTLVALSFLVDHALGAALGVEGKATEKSMGKSP